MVKCVECYRIQTDPYDSNESSSATIPVRICLFTDVRNQAEIKQTFLLDDCENDPGKKTECALVKAELILEPFQLLTAVQRAVCARNRGKLATKNLHTELLYSLSPTKNISESLKTFGMDEGSSAMILVVIGDGKDLEKIAKKIKGKPTPLSKNAPDLARIKSVYHVRDPDLNKGSLVDSIVTRIVTKDYVA